MRCVPALIGLVLLGAFAAADVYGLEIEVGPQTLVVSSCGDNLTVHTNFSGFPSDGDRLEITPAGGPTKVVDIVARWTYDRGYYVVRCDRQVAAEAVGEFDGKWTTATVTLTVYDELGGCGSDEIAVRK
jgi:hypothetical protein